MPVTIDAPIQFTDGTRPRSTLRLPSVAGEGAYAGATTYANTIPSFAKDIKNAYWKGYRFASEGAYWGIPVVAMETALAKPGEVIPTLAAKSIGLAIQPIAGGVASAALAATLGLPPVAAALAATVLVGYATSQLENSMVRNFTTLSKAGAEAQRVRFGAGFMDTRTAQQRRNRAATELAGALPASRRWLGQEALFLHK
jgi:hypothetical protein